MNKKFLMTILVAFAAQQSFAGAPGGGGKGEKGGKPGAKSETTTRTGTAHNEAVMGSKGSTLEAFKRAGVEKITKTFAGRFDQNELNTLMRVDLTKLTTVDAIKEIFGENEDQVDAAAGIVLVGLEGTASQTKGWTESQVTNYTATLKRFNDALNADSSTQLRSESPDDGGAAKTESATRVLSKAMKAAVKEREARRKLLVECLRAS